MRARECVALASAVPAPHHCARDEGAFALSVEGASEVRGREAVLLARLRDSRGGTRGAVIQKRSGAGGAAGQGGGGSSGRTRLGAHGALAAHAALLRGRHEGLEARRWAAHRGREPGPRRTVEVGRGQIGKQSA